MHTTGLGIIQADCVGNHAVCEERVVSNRMDKDESHLDRSIQHCLRNVKQPQSTREQTCSSTVGPKVEPPAGIEPRLPQHHLESSQHSAVLTQNQKEIIPKK